MTLRFRIALEFHECVRFLAEAKSQLTCMRDRLSEQLGLVYNHHFPTAVHPPSVIDATPTPPSVAEAPITESASTAETQMVALSSPTRSTYSGAL